MTNALQPSYPQPVAEVLSTLIEIFQHQKQTEMVTVLESAHARFDWINHDNWDGGIDTWALRLEIPVVIFASLSSRLAEVEKTILDSLGFLGRSHPSDPIAEITITPITGASASTRRNAVPEIEARRLWTDGKLRLFLSHVSKHKVLVSKLKEELALRGVDAFVAHEDIEPSLEWQKEIELGLRSMNALAALITPDFHESSWTDQEVGWALGRAVPVFSVRLPKDPYGFMGKIQGIPGTLEKPAELATSLVKAMLINPTTHTDMRRSLLTAFAEAPSFAAARVLCSQIVELTDFSDDEKSILQKACVENSQVANAFGVRGAVYKLVGAPPPKPTKEVRDVPF